ncbi:prepilin-type N-terminal cleavage/methylation domain-containing protein [bacterium]|nr:prepilin-type N-terminal cleavage/methylation domain-containing protein [bacterium]
MRSARTTNGVTLIELILVMAVLATMLAVAAPAMGRFFAGRRMVEESRRVYALVRYARNAAIERSARAEMWIEPETGKYGLDLTAVAGQEEAAQPIEWQLDDKLHFDIDSDAVVENGRVTILFLPDGTTDEAAASRIGIREEDGQGLDVRKRTDGFGYDLVDIGVEDEAVNEGGTNQNRK